MEVYALVQARMVRINKEPRSMKAARPYKPNKQRPPLRVVVLQPFQELGLLRVPLKGETVLPPFVHNDVIKVPGTMDDVHRIRLRVHKNSMREFFSPMACDLFESFMTGDDPRTSDFMKRFVELADKKIQEIGVTKHCPLPADTGYVCKSLPGRFDISVFLKAKGG